MAASPFAYYLGCTVGNILVKFSCIVQKTLVNQMSKSPQKHIEDNNWKASALLGFWSSLAQNPAPLIPSVSVKVGLRVLTIFTSLISLIDRTIFSSLLTRWCGIKNVISVSIFNSSRSWGPRLSFQMMTGCHVVFSNKDLPSRTYSKNISRYLRLNEDT